MLETKIIEAIKGRHPIEFVYDNKKRLANPYIYGKSTAHNFVVSAYQTGGESTKKLPGWRQFMLNKITNLIVHSEIKFSPTDPEYNPHDRLFASITVQI
jgi:hypothetical protein